MPVRISFLKIPFVFFLSVPGVVILFVFFACSVRPEPAVSDTCQKNKILSCNEFYGRNNKIDTVESSTFTALVDDLYDKVHSGKVLNLDEDRTLVLIMNTITWSEYDKQQGIENRYKNLFSIKELFEKHYKERLHCKYRVCGSGYSSYFVELNVEYSGNRMACARYFVIPKT